MNDKEKTYQKSNIIIYTTDSRLDYNAFEKGVGGMCTLFEEIAKENEAKGIVETGYDFGVSENEILERLQNKRNVSLEMAQEYIKMFGKKTV